MAKAVSEEEIQLRKRARRRLIGAIALVTVVAVFLPMVLDHDPKPINREVGITIPSPSSSEFKSKIVPVTPAPKDGVRGSALPTTPAPAPPSTTMPETAASVPPAHDSEAAPPRGEASKRIVEKAKAVPDAPVASVPKPSAKPATIAKSPEPAGVKGSGNYVVQVAALTDAAKAREMQQKMIAAGIKTYTEVVPTTKGDVTRVRAGPYSGREEAEKVRDKLKGLGLTGNLVQK